MKLNVDFSELQLATSKMLGLPGLLAELRKQKFNYKTGLSKAVEFVNDNGGNVIDLPDNNTKLVIGDDEAICFHPYPDVDLFYYEN